MYGRIYLLVFPNGKMYVGLTKRPTIERRMAEHRCHLKRGRGRMTALYPAWVKHGEPMVVDMGSYPHEELPQREIDLIASLNTQVPNGYNITAGGDMTAATGWRHSPEARAKIAAALRVRVRKLETTEKIKATWTPERRAAHMAARKGVKRSPESVEKTRAAHSTPEAKAHFAALRKGTTLSEETKEKIRAAHNTPQAIARKREVHGSQEGREKAAARRRGIKHNEETKARMKEAQRARWATYTPEKRAEVGRSISAGRKGA